MKTPVRAEHIDKRIFFIRGRRVMLDSDLAHIYGVSTTRLNQQVNRNRRRFPVDFIFRLTKREFDNLILQIATSSSGYGGRRKLPYVFTEHGAIMLASVLNTPVAIQASVQVVRAFVRLRGILSVHKEFARRLDALERHVKDHDVKINIVFDAIHELMNPAPKPPPRQIGFQVPSK